ncbi:hypothetical protein [Asticcacaulis sp.]|uniref:hypothetical protein n=1 Tax=Asticcacaulis sp. TaxID=1872648 RepID=UPI002634A69E|nr:hypothetical protein [Asticcacaulis sp.]
MIFAWGRTRYVGKTVLIGISFVDDDEVVLGTFQTHGTIVEISSGQGIVVAKADGSGTFNLPPDTKALEKAPPGEYRLKTTGEVVIDPHYTTSWTLNAARPELMENYKQNGFGPFGPS